jgi:uncharacterized protein (TIGR00369 family)
MSDPQPLHDQPTPGFDGHMGVEWLRMDAEEVRARARVQPFLLQPAGLVHGGVYAAMAESMASLGTWVGAGHDKFVAGMSNNTTFLRPITEGTIHAVARPLHSGRTTWVWDVEITDDAGRRCAASRVTIAVREPRA